MGKDSFILYDNYVEQIEFLTDEQAGVLLKAIYAYRHGKSLPKMDGAVKMAFSFIRSQIDRDQEKYETMREVNKANGQLGAVHGKKGGRPKKTPNGDLKTPKNPEKPRKTPDNEYEYEYEYDTDKKEIGTNVPTKKETERSVGQKAEIEFFKRFPLTVDNYSYSDYAEIDFERLTKAFEESEFLRGMNSFSWVCSNYRKIVSGAYKDFARNKPQERTYKPIGPEWDGI